MATDYPPYAGSQTVAGPLASVVQNDVASLAHETATETRLGFRVGGLGFLLPINLHCEVIERQTINPIPRVEPWFSGLLNNRGAIVPVIDLHSLFGEAARHDQKRRLFAIGRGEKTVALWIDGYPQMLTGEQPLATLPALPEQLQRWVTGAYLHTGQLWLNVEFEQLFNMLGRQQAARGTVS